MIRLANVLFLLTFLMVRSDICGHYSVLTEIQSFFITQPFTQTINIGFEDYFSAMTELRAQATKFNIIAQNYTSRDKLKLMEPQTLIPFGPNKNLIKIPETQHTLLMAECQKYGAQFLSFDPWDKQDLLKILKEQNLESVPFFAYQTPRSLLSRGIKLLESPLVPANLLKIGVTGYPLLYQNGTIGYPEPGQTEAEFRSVALCEKENNYWDRSSENQKTFTNLLGKILNKIPQLFDTGSTFIDTIAMINKLPKPSFSVMANKYSFSAPSSLVQMVNLFQKYNNKNSWETSKPTAILDFLNFTPNFNKIINLFKFKKPKKLTDQIIFSNNSILLSTVEEERLLTFLGLEPEQFGISGPVGIQPVMVLPENPTTENEEKKSTSMAAQIKMNIYDRKDIVRIHTVRPLISNGQVTTVTHVVVTPRYVQATESEPVPHQCTKSEKDAIQVCEGFQTTGPEEQHQQTLLTCGRALTQTNVSVDFNKCPTKPSPPNPLVYRANCDGERMVVLSSPYPLTIKVYCDTFVEESKQFNSFPVYIQTECEIREVLNETDKILLPQLQVDFHQQQRVRKIVTMKPTTIIAKEIYSLLEEKPWVLTLAIAISITVILLFFLILVLALFDPQRCKKVTEKRICCCFICMHRKCQKCCGKTSCSCCKPENDITQIEMKYIPRRNQYSTNNSTTSAPPLDLDKVLEDNELTSFIPSKLPLSRRSSRSSVNEIKMEAKKNQNNVPQSRTNQNY